MLSSMATPKNPGTVSRQYEQVMQLLADKISSLDPPTMAKIARLLVDCSDVEKCVAHHLIENSFVGENEFLRFRWLLTKAGQPDCMPRDRRLWRELQALKEAHDRRGKPVTRRRKRS